MMNARKGDVAFVPWTQLQMLQQQDHLFLLTSQPSPEPTQHQPTPSQNSAHSPTTPPPTTPCPPTYHTTSRSPAPTSSSSQPQPS
ncbi:hypothetical protein BAUCODRAFT_33247 [Baudoinia panamericana UAMH 10762]|uniref:Uncharacterized protein n=1 Tax=Baudoinia panamericana (strain UAMH 10762) TaxID=717646 RepID=M2NE87_BAUPA|nr:uncharacterized protein BAUCODRAFT_33247 [Baudoinia panamericana UAMH 10762]EMC97529.1 hypothetical protein BAUCODRAFT_33247 [Baudoinia panamericana UAMH 10762]